MLWASSPACMGADGNRRMCAQVPTWCVEEGSALHAELEELYELEEEDVMNCSPSLDGVWTHFNLSVTIS